MLNYHQNRLNLLKYYTELMSGLVCLSANEVAILIEVVVEGGVDGAELLQRLHLPEAEHRPFPSPERQM